MSDQKNTAGPVGAAAMCTVSRHDPERLSLSLALFNNHVNNADRRARDLMRKLMPVWLEEVERVEKKGNGIMYVFMAGYTPATAAYAALVTAFVNENRGLNRAPRYEHDCSECIFLGRYLGGAINKCTEFDLYYHPATCHHRPTVLARYGDEPHAYSSGLASGLNGSIASLAEAVRRAKEMGLNVEMSCE